MPTVLQYLCDPCDDNGEVVPGSHTTARIGNLERSVILCPNHAQMIVEPLLAVLRDHGVKVEPNAIRPTTPRRAVGAVQVSALPVGMTAEEARAILDEGKCIFDNSHGPFVGRAGAVSHLHVHGTSVNQLGIAYTRGNPAPAPPTGLPSGMSTEEADALVESGNCPFDESHGPYPSRRDAVMHLKTHGVTARSLGIARPGRRPATGG